MGDKNCFEDLDQEGYSSLGKRFLGCIPYTIWARNLTELETTDAS